MTEPTHAGTASPGATARLVAAFALFVVVTAIAATPAAAQITSVSPGSRSVPEGTFAQISVSVTTDQAAVASGGCSGPVTISGGGAGPTAGFTVTVPATTPQGSYSCSFTDGTDSASFTVNVVEPPPTTTTSSTTTTTQAPTTTRPPTTTTTRPPTTTTTSSTTTTTEAPTTTTSSTTTTTTQPPTTTTTQPPTTTTTQPPTTTSSTLVPAAIGPGDDSGSSGLPWPVIGGGALLVGLLALGGFAWSRRQPSGPRPGRATPALFLAWDRRREQRRLRSQAKARRSTSRIGLWWRTSGPVARWRDWRSAQGASKTVRRQIEERQRMRRDQP